MAPPPGLLGPPSIHRPAPPSSAGKPDKQSQVIPRKSHQSQVIAWNRHSLTSKRTQPFQNHCIDFCFSDPPLSTLTDRLQKAWAHNPLTTLELIFRLRGPQVAGKKPDETFYMAMHWLHRNHPLTLACNIRVFSNCFGCVKDLLEVLRLVLEHQEVYISKETMPWRRKKTIKEEKKNPNFSIKEKALVRAKRAAEKQNPNFSSKEKALARAKRAVEWFANDANYRLLHNQISESIADLLRSDLQFLESGEIEKISIASKWCPSIDSSYDKSTLICENIARKLFPKSEDEYKCIEEAHYSYRVRDRLRKQVLNPLRKALDSTNRAPPTMVCMKEDEKGIRVCEKADQRLRYSPQKLVASLKGGRRFSINSKVAELQWWNLLEHTSKKGYLNNCMAICNVSAAMGRALTDMSIGMGLLISELSQKPWKGRVFTFDSNPKLLHIKGYDPKSKMEFMRKMKCGESVNLSNVFDQVLKFAESRKLSQDEMVKRIFVFTNVGYEEGTDSFSNFWATLNSYRSRGYTALPEIVFWNLGGCVKSPMRGEGLVIVNGFSESLVSLFLKEGGVSTLDNAVKLVPKPEVVMESAISTDEFRDLFVFD